MLGISGGILLNLPDYLRLAEVDVSLPRPVMDILDNSELLDVSDSLSPHRHALRLLSVEELTKLVVTRMRWVLWTTHVAEAVAPESSVLDLTLYPDEVDAVVRAGDSAETLLRVWRTAVEYALANSKGEVVVAQKNHPRAAQYSAWLGQIEQVINIPADAWFELWTGVKSGALKIEWSHAAKDITSACQEDLDALSGQDSGALIKDFVLAHLDDGLVNRKTVNAREDVVGHSMASYRELLMSKPAGGAPVGGVYVGTDRQRVGLALLDKRGGVSSTAPVRPSGDWCDRVCRWMRDNRAKVVVLPDTAPAEAWLENIRQALTAAELNVRVVSAQGMVVARGADDPVLRRVSPEIASAIILCRRAQRPLDAWSQAEPERFGLVPMSAGLTPQAIKELLHIVREHCIAGEQPLMTGPVKTGGIRGRKEAPINPMVRGIRDLRPGLTLNGVVSNVTKFGAFVNIGLRQEGLVHISELSDEFINEPGEVVQQGQEVSVRVISVDIERGRIALSMRGSGPPAAFGPPGAGGDSADGPRMPPGPPRQGGGNKARPNSPERSKALQDLESLFKK